MEPSIGKCTCGELEFECAGNPINSVFCYCPSCQKLTNSDKWLGIWHPKDSISFTKGKPSIFTVLVLIYLNLERALEESDVRLLEGKTPNSPALPGEN